jgi:carboxymethylenebutenolidase
MCFDENARPPIPILADTGAHGDAVKLKASDGAEFAAYLAQPGEEPEAQIVILPDVRGLHTFYRELADRFAEMGARALAIDYFGRTAGNDDRNGDFDYAPHVQQMSQETFGQDLAAAVDFIREGSDLPTFVLGFCMGGALSFWSGTQGLQLAGVIGFYAALNRRAGAVTPVLEFAPEIESPVLGLFGGADQGIPQEDVDRFERALTDADVEHEIVTYPGAPHSFFDRQAAAHADASADAWGRVRGFVEGRSLERV